MAATSIIFFLPTTLLRFLRICSPTQIQPNLLFPIQISLWNRVTAFFKMEFMPWHNRTEISIRSVNIISDYTTVDDAHPRPRGGWSSSSFPSGTLNVSLSMRAATLFAIFLMSKIWVTCRRFFLFFFFSSSPTTRNIVPRGYEIFRQISAKLLRHGNGCKQQWIL